MIAVCLLFTNYIFDTSILLIKGCLATLIVRGGTLLLGVTLVLLLLNLMYAICIALLFKMLNKWSNRWIGNLPW
jgi:hypothetical protein